MSAPESEVLEKACGTLAGADPSLATVYNTLGPPVWRTASPSYATLCRLIMHQQISTTAAQAIRARFTERFGEEVAPEVLLACDPEEVRACGLSRPKVKHLRSIATAIEAGELDLDRVAASPFDAAKDELLAVSGIGPWTAELFLLYATAALDAFPTADLGLLESLRMLDGADERLDKAAFTERAEAWRPFRGVAAHLLWAWIGAERERLKKASPQA